MKAFEYDGGFMKFAILLSRLTLLNLIWLVCCIPIVTAGAATAAQYYSVSLLLQGKTEVFKNFKEGLRIHWKKATIVWIIFVVLVAMFCMEYYILTTATVPGKTALMAVSGLAFLTLVLIMLWVYPVMVNFAGTVRELLFNAFVFTFMYAPITLIAVAVYGGVIYLFIRFTIAKGLCVVFGQALVVYIILTVFNKVFQKYKEK